MGWNAADRSGLVHASRSALVPHTALPASPKALLRGRLGELETVSTERKIWITGASPPARAPPRVIPCRGASESPIDKTISAGGQIEVTSDGDSSASDSDGAGEAGHCNMDTCHLPQPLATGSIREEQAPSSSPCSELRDTRERLADVSTVLWERHRQGRRRHCCRSQESGSQGRECGRIR